MIIFYDEQAKRPLSHLLDDNTLAQLEAIKQAPNFKTFNQQENHFPSAAINCFLDYATYKAHEQTEEMQDYRLNEDIMTVQEEQILYITEQREQPPGPPKEKIASAFGESYPRSLVESTAAKINSHWQCEYDSTHTTFIGKNNNPYVEAHHLIPMSKQDFFDINIDVAGNIVSLCPNCHRKIHFAQPEEKKAMLTQLFAQRIAFYEKYNISITLPQLLSFYNIFN